MDVERPPRSDFNHKPEIAVALTPFLGFAGFQPISTIQSLLTTLPEIDSLLRPFESYRAFIDASAQAGPKELKELVRSVLKLNHKSDSGVLKSVTDAIAVGTGMKGSDNDNLKRDGVDVDKSIEGLLARVQQEGTAVFSQSHLTAEQSERLVLALKKMQQYYKGDPASIVAAFMMNLIELKPGEAIYVGADGVHAWLDGRELVECRCMKFGSLTFDSSWSLSLEIIELMATSDNVLNLGFVPAAEKDSVDMFIDAVTCEPKSGDEYKLKKQEWKLSEGAGATVYKVGLGYHTKIPGLNSLPRKRSKGPDRRIFALPH